MSSVVDELFYNKYWIRVEEAAFYTEEYLREVGIEGVNSEEEAKEVLNYLRTVRLNIPTIAEFYDKGFKLQFVDNADASEIYRIIDTHLNDWLTVCNRNSYIASIPPIEDFEKLDALANLFYDFRDRNTAVNKLQNVLSTIFSKRSAMETSGVYQPYSPKLYPYCALVNQEN